MFIKIAIILITMPKSKPRNGYEQFNGRGWFTDQAARARKGLRYETSFAQILDPYFGLGGRDNASLGLHMNLSTAEYGPSAGWDMYSLRDIEEFLRKMRVEKVEQLHGRVIEIYRPEPLRITGIGVNQNLVPQTRSQ